jgi:heme-degrading monooxygenase HmoA
MAVRVMVFGKLKHLEDQEAFEALITQVSQHIKGTKGYIKDELLRDSSDPAGYIMMSEWSNAEDFLQWEQAPIHKQNTSPLRAYWSADAVFKMYEIVSH